MSQLRSENLAVVDENNKFKRQLTSCIKENELLE